MLTLKDIAWVGGLLEGEGCFQLLDYYPIISITSTDKDTIEKLKIITKLTGGIYRHKDKRENHKVTYQVRIVGILAIQWMMTLYSLMSQRRKAKIKDIIEGWKVGRPAKPTRTHCKNGHMWNKENIRMGTNGSYVCILCQRECIKRSKSKMAVKIQCK